MLHVQLASSHYKKPENVQSHSFTNVNVLERPTNLTCVHLTRHRFHTVSARLNTNLKRWMARSADLLRPVDMKPVQLRSRLSKAGQMLTKSRNYLIPASQPETRTSRQNLAIL